MSSAGRPLVGQSVARVEDGRILTGSGRYMDDLVLPGMLEGVFVRSDLGHADRSPRSTPSVPGRCRAFVAVITAAELEGAVSPLQVAGGASQSYLRPVFRALADGKVRFVGDPVAFDRRREPLPGRGRAGRGRGRLRAPRGRVTMDQAADPALPALFDDVGSTVLYTETMNLG